MRNLRILFVTSVHGNWLDRVGALVRAVTGSRWAHVGGYLFDGIYESVLPEVMVSPRDKYKNDKVQETLVIRITEAEYMSIESAARKYLGGDVKYGIRDCIVGGVATLWGRKAAWFFSKILFTDCDTTKNCVGIWACLLLTTETFGKYMRSMGWNETNVSYMTPQDLYSLIKSFK